MLFMGVSVLSAAAHSIPFSENFDGDWRTNFPLLLELDHQPVASSINPMFMDGDGVSRPWWVGKDYSTATDRFLMSHSWYQTPGASNDWVCSRPIEISGHGFTLFFGAQYVPVRSGHNVPSSLEVFITERPISADNLPTDPVLFIDEVPVGNSLTDAEGDFTEYNVDLDPWAGKTIYLSFANRNNDSDIVCINDVLVRRFDAVGIQASSPEYVVEGEYKVIGLLDGTLPEGLDNWKLTFEAYGNDPQEISGVRINQGDEIPFEFTAMVGGDDVSDWKLTLTGDGWEPVILRGETIGLLFEAHKRVLMEEATGTWCGNCPAGIYTVENMIADDELKDMVIPVAVHIPGSGPDYMVEPNYAAQLGLSQAPMVRLDRTTVVGFSGYDYNFDKEDERTFAWRVRNMAKKPALVDIELTPRFVVAGNDTLSIDCNVKVHPALTLDQTQHAIGLILVENNVGLDIKEWEQANYFSDFQRGVDLGGWGSLKEHQGYVRYQDVGRGVWGFNGIPDSLPWTLEGGGEHEFNYSLQLFDTTEEVEINGKNKLVSPPMKTEHMVVVAYVVDTDSCEILNAVSVPMSEKAEDRFDTQCLLQKLSVETVGTSAAGSSRYFNLQGLEIPNPTPGDICIEVLNGKARKIIK